MLKTDDVGDAGAVVDGASRDDVETGTAAESKDTETTVDADVKTEDEQTEELGDDGAELPAAVQESINKRIGKEIEKTRKATERVGALEAQIEDLKGRTDEAWMQAAQAVAVHPAYLPKEEALLIRKANELEAEELRLSESPDGIESDDPKVAMTGQQVRRRLTEIRQELTRLAPKADSAYSKAKAQQIADMELGRKIRVERETAAAKARAAKAGEKTKTDGAAPGGAQAPTRPVSTGTETRASLSVKRFKEQGGNRDAAAKELGNLVPIPE